MKLLVVRNDRLGDALLALPSLLALRVSLPDSAIDFYCSREVVPAVRPWLLANKMEAISSWVPGQLRKNYDAVLFLHDDPELMYESWREWVGIRLGIYSRAASFLFLNGGRLQRRSKAEKNEAQYNLDLARLLIEKVSGKKVPLDPEKIRLPVNRWESERVAEWLTGKALKKQYVVIHPGMGGSALNFSTEGYVKLARNLALQGTDVIFSEGPADTDRRLVAGIRKQEPGIIVATDFSLQETMELFRRAHCVVAPSTGPLHLAHYVGAMTVGIFSPVLAHHPKRWAPWGGVGEVRLCTPMVKCGGLRDCIREACESFYCLDSLQPERLIFGEQPVLVGG